MKLQQVIPGVRGDYWTWWLSSTAPSGEPVSWAHTEKAFGGHEVPTLTQGRDFFCSIFCKHHYNMSSNKELTSFKGAFSVLRQLYWSTVLLLKQNLHLSSAPLGQKMTHISLFQLSPPPVKSWLLGFWFKSKGDHLPPVVQRNPSCTRRYVKMDLVSRRYEKEDLRKLQTLKKTMSLEKEVAFSNRTPRKCFINISKSRNTHY